MPIAIYLLSLCSFAFGLSEFIAAGLLSGMARELHASVAATGGAIAAYALGAAIGAPILTALLARRSDRLVLAATMLVLAVGSVGMAGCAGLDQLAVAALPGGPGAWRVHGGGVERRHQAGRTVALGAGAGCRLAG